MGRGGEWIKCNIVHDSDVQWVRSRGNSDYFAVLSNGS